MNQRKIAAALGISPSTVSRYLRGQLNVSPDIALRIDEEVGDNWPRPARDKPSTVGLITPGLENPYFAALAEAVAEAAAQADINLFTLMTGSYAHREHKSVAYIAQLANIDGLIYLGANPINTALDMQVIKDMPVVFLDEMLPVSGAKMAQVTAENYGGAYQATAYLIRTGHQTIAHLGGPPELRTAEERVRGYRDALIGHGLQVNEELIFRGAFSEQFGANFFAMANRSFLQPTAVLSASDIGAVGVLEAARQLAIDIPAELSVIGCDGTIVSEWVTPRLTNIQQPINDMAKRAVEEISSIIAGNTPVNHALSMSLQIRESTRKL